MIAACGQGGNAHVGAIGKTVPWPGFLRHTAIAIMAGMSPSLKYNKLRKILDRRFFHFLADQSSLLGNSSDLLPRLIIRCWCVL